jgi:hypothetical protein
LNTGGLVMGGRRRGRERGGEGDRGINSQSI